MGVMFPVGRLLVKTVALRAAEKEFGALEICTLKTTTDVGINNKWRFPLTKFYLTNLTNPICLRGEVFMLSTVVERARELLERLKELGDAL